MATTESGQAMGAATEYTMWLQSWAGAGAVLQVTGAAYQDLAGNAGREDKQLALVVPGSDLWKRAADIGSTATALSAAASAFGATAAATATGAGGSTSLIRSFGHTQFLAMSVSMAVPWLPSEYIRLCTGLSWSNLVTPAEHVVKLTNNATSQLRQQQAGTAAGRHLMDAGGSSSTSNGMPACFAGAPGECTVQPASECSTDKQGRQQCTSRSAAVRANHQHAKEGTHAQRLASMQQLQQQFEQDATRRRRLLSAGSRSIDQWFLQHADFGTFQSSNGSIAGNNSGVFVVSASSGSGSSSDAILLAGTTRQPADFSLHDLRMSVLTLAVAVAVATLLQGLAVGAWKLFRLNPDNLPMLVRFPKPQLLMYTLLMVPVIYGAAKLVAAAGSSGDTSAGVACIVLLPLPVLAYWAYVLWIWHTDPLDATRRSKSSIMRAYQRPASAPGIAEGQAAAASQQQRAQATLALLGDLDDNPTLIIRDRRSGEDGLDEIFDRGDHSSSDDGEVERSRLPASRPTASGAGGAAAGTAADGMARVRSQRQVAVSVEARPQQGGSKWRSLASEAGGGSGSGARPAGNASGAGGGSARSSRSMEGSSPGGVLGSRSKVLRAGSPAAPAGEELAPQAGTHRPALLSFLPVSAHDDEMLSAPGGSAAHAELRSGRPLAEGIEEQQAAGEDSQQAAMAAAWNAARADYSRSATGWGATATRPADTVSLTGVAVAGNEAHGPITRQQTWFGEDGASAQQQQQQQQQQGVHAGFCAGGAAAGRFLDRFWYMLDDLLGDERPQALARVKLPILVFYIVSSVQRVLTALFFGFYHFSYISVAQLGVLLALHALFVVYLLLVRPYASKLLLGSDVVAYACELTILSAALLLREAPNTAALKLKSKE
ncbi:hypothetical protein OEZ86_014352 [Tetradesmus obliquus]|nr:hypothetical protein OEZ86_014352 [Tetradesmus obliquus]